MRVTALAWVWGIVAVASACDAADPPAVRPPRSAGPTPTVTLPAPPEAEGNLHTGAAIVTLSGAATSFELDLVDPGLWRQSNGAFIATWSDGEGHTLGVGGILREGTLPTSDQLRVTIALEGGRIYSSTDGECTVEVGEAEVGSISGTFACDDAPGGAGQHLDATGEFFAAT